MRRLLCNIVGLIIFFMFPFLAFMSPPPYPMAYFYHLVLLIALPFTMFIPVRYPSTIIGIFILATAPHVFLFTIALSSLAYFGRKPQSALGYFGVVFLPIFRITFNLFKMPKENTKR